jgi:hypothetical protein
MNTELAPTVRGQPGKTKSFSLVLIRLAGGEAFVPLEFDRNL